MSVSIVRSNVMKTDASVGIVIPTAARHNFSIYLKQVEQALLKSSRHPKFFIVKHGPFDKAFLSSHGNAVESIAFIEGTEPMGERLVLGLGTATKEKNDLLIFTCDDFDHLVGSIGGFAKKLGEGNDFLAGAWDGQSHKHLPYTMFVNESAISTAVTYANPSHEAGNKPPRPGDLDSFLRFRSSSDGTWHQTYVGLSGLVSQAWDRLANGLDDIFDGQHDVKNVGLEAGLMVVAHHIGLKVEQMEIPKRFEHPLLDKGTADYPAQNEVYRRGRIAQFLSGITLVEAYVTKFSPEKLEVIQELKQNSLELLKTADFYWPAPNEAWPVPTKWNMQVRSAF